MKWISNILFEYVNKELESNKLTISKIVKMKSTLKQYRKNKKTKRKSTKRSKSTKRRKSIKRRSRKMR